MGAVAIFVKDASLDNLRFVFETALRPSTWFHFWYHSDDSFAALQWQGKTLWLEMDISSCDTSHGPEIFSKFLSTMPVGRVYDAVKATIDQCLLPLHIVCPTNKWKKVVLEPVDPVLYSGSTLTTILNCFGCLLIFVALSTHKDDFDACKTIEEIKSLTIQLASKAGYIVTVEVWEHVQQATFLKHSSNSNGEPWLNLGVVQRLSGSCKGDVPGRGDINHRCELVQSQLIEGLVHAGDSSVTRALRTRFPKMGLKQRIRTGSYIVDSINDNTTPDTPPVIVTDADIMYRYNLNEIELDALVNHISHFAPGRVIDCSASRKIYTKDYGAIF